jgi:hypothetical protein
MKPYLFRSISNSLAASFPLLSRIRRSFIGLLMFCILFLLIGISESEGITIPVKPVKYGQYDNQKITTYSAGVVKLGGQLIISHSDLLDRVLLPNVITDLDMLTLLFMAIASTIIIWIVPKLQDKHLFRRDISNAIRLLGYLTMLHGMMGFYRISIYGPNRIKFLTHNEFTNQGSFPLMICAELYFSLIIIALAGIYHRGVKLQQEQDLTV